MGVGVGVGGVGVGGGAQSSLGLRAVIRLQEAVDLYYLMFCLPSRYLLCSSTPSDTLKACVPNFLSNNENMHQQCQASSIVKGLLFMPSLVLIPKP